MFEAILTLPTLARRLEGLGGGKLSGSSRSRLCFLVGLHDTGKAVHGFQARLRGEKPDCGHIAPLWDVLEGGAPTDQDKMLRRDLLAAVGQPRWQGWFQPWDPDPDSAEAPPDAKAVRGWFWQAVLAHHGSLPAGAGNLPSDQWRPRAGYAPLEALAALSEALAVMFPAAYDADAPPLPASPRFLHALAGLITLADWLGSDQNVFAFPDDGAPTGLARIAWARQQATGLIARRGLESAAARAVAETLTPDFASLFPGLAAPRPAQAALLSAPLPPPGQIVTLEAETGSGKTEAALAHYFRLFRAGEVDGLYFGLPTRAAAVQIHERVRDTVRRWLGEAAPAVGLAVPGYLRVDDAEGERLPDAPGVLWPDRIDPDRVWAVERAKSYLSGAIMVGTVDQVLMGGLQVRHAQFRSSPMLRLLLVVDEVHASDAYMGLVLRNVLDQHVAAGGHALLMSATLGAEARASFLQIGQPGPVKAPPLVEAAALAYPALQRRGEALQGLAHDGRAKKVAIELIKPDGLDALLARVAAAAEAGAAVLVIRNTVDGAREAFARLEELNAPLLCCCDVRTPHHSRYAPEDRRRLDKALEAAFSDPEGRVRAGVVAVTTQTAEQSLDICADWLVTDLCPGDVLLQRLGRLHRHQRARPTGFGVAQVAVIAPEAAELAARMDTKGNAKGRMPLGIGGGVYHNAVAVLATRAWLAERGALAIPADNRSLVEAATHTESLKAIAARLGEPWVAHLRHVEGEIIGQRGIARLNCLKWEKPLVENQPATDQTILTRLGLNDRRIDLPVPLTGPFGGSVSGFNLPGWMAERLGAVVAPEEVTGSVDGIIFRLGERWFGYDRLGLREVRR